MRSFGSRSARSTTYSSPTTSGSVLPRILSPSSMISRRSSTGRPMISEKTHIGISAATDSTQSNSSRSNAVVRIPRARPRIRSSYVLITRGVKPLLTSAAHPRVRRRIRVEHRLPRLELLVGEVLERRPAELARERLPVLRDRDDVVVAGEGPEAVALDLGLPEHGRVAAQEGEPVVRHALLPRVEVGEVDVVERQALERRRGDGDRAGLLVGHVVVARVGCLLGIRWRRQPHEERAGVLARLVDRERLEGRRRQHVARPHVELRSVARAHHDGAVELALGERALLVRAGVVERDPRAAEATDADSAPAGLDAPEVTLRRVAGRTDVVPLLFRHYCAGR